MSNTSSISTISLFKKRKTSLPSKAELNNIQKYSQEKTCKAYLLTLSTEEFSETSFKFLFSHLQNYCTQLVKIQKFNAWLEKKNKLTSKQMKEVIIASKNILLDNKPLLLKMDSDFSSFENLLDKLNTLSNHNEHYLNSNLTQNIIYHFLEEIIISLQEIKNIRISNNQQISLYLECIMELIQHIQDYMLKVPSSNSNNI
ncbi:MAG: hypothetical protein LEGION0398_MBIBDBAK_00087 [Legionellaceae bacterium]